MILPITGLKRREIDWLAVHDCEHGHTYLEHYSCYKKYHGDKERVGILDIETTDLTGDYGYILTYCIKKYGGETLKRFMTKDDVRRGTYDKRIMRQFIQDCKGFDRFITYYGARFDIPELRTRALYWKLPFPIHKSVKHTDIYFIVKFKLKLRRNSLMVACQHLGIKAKGHPLLPEIRWKAMNGDAGAIKYILTHNIEDVESTEKLYNRIKDFAPVRDNSI